jgi:hypothetical protein
MRHFFKLGSRVVPCSLLALAWWTVGCATFSAPPPSPPEEDSTPTMSLFDGKTLKGFYMYLGAKPGEKEPVGRDKDPAGIFTVVDGTIRLSGEIDGYLATNDTFGDFHLTADVKWGDKQFASREGKARASAIMYHVNGPDGIWPPAKLEYQLVEGGMGNLYIGRQDSGIDLTEGLKPRLCKSVKITPDGKRASAGCIYRDGRSPDWKNEKGFHAAGDIERPVGDWNRIEITAQGGTITHSLNGKVVLRAVGADPKKGRFLFLSEGSEVFFRDIHLTTL